LESEISFKTINIVQQIKNALNKVRSEIKEFVTIELFCLV